MTAAPAAGDPPPHPNTLDTLSSIPEDNEVLVFLTDRAPIIAFYTKNSRGTQTNIEHHVTKIPSQRHTATRHDDTNRSAIQPTAPRFPSPADDEDLGFQALVTSPNNRSPPKQRGTHRAATTHAKTPPLRRLATATHNHQPTAPCTPPPTDDDDLGFQAVVTPKKPSHLMRRGTQRAATKHATPPSSQRQIHATHHHPPKAPRSPSSADDEDTGFKAIVTPLNNHSHPKRRSTSLPHPEDALDRAFANLYDDLRAFLHSELQLMLPMKNPFRQTNQPTSPPHPKKRPPTAAQRRKPVESN